MNLRRALIAAILSTLVVMGALSWVDSALQNDAAPLGIVSFELAGSPDATRAILDSWDPRAKLFAAFSLGLDMLFLVCYATAIALAAAATQKLFAPTRVLHRIGRPIIIAMPIAALLDAVENMALFRCLTEPSVESPWPEVALVCATIKFALVIAGLLYALLGGVAALRAQK